MPKANKLAQAALPVISGGQVKLWRESLDMTQGEFGALLAGLLGRARAYDRREVSLIERGTRVAPEAVQRVFWQYLAKLAGLSGGGFGAST